MLHILQAGGASLLLFIVPGLAWSTVFFQNLSLLERGLLSFALSIALMVLAVIGLNLVFDVAITPLLIVVVDLVLAAVPGGYWLVKRQMNRPSRKPSA